MKNLIILLTCISISMAVDGKISDLEIGTASAVGLYARYLKRIAAHSRNLISSIVNPFERIGYPE